MGGQPPNTPRTGNDGRLVTLYRNTSELLPFRVVRSVVHDTNLHVDNPSLHSEESAMRYDLEERLQEMDNRKGNRARRLQTLASKVRDFEP